MSRNYINIFMEDRDEITLAETDAGRYHLVIGTELTIFFNRTADLDKFMSNINQLYEDHNARKEARRARKDNGSKEGTITHKNLDGSRRITKTTEA